jgi:hypothetical protein
MGHIWNCTAYDCGPSAKFLAVCSSSLCTHDPRKMLITKATDMFVLWTFKLDAVESGSARVSDRDEACQQYQSNMQQ